MRDKYFTDEISECERWELLRVLGMDHKPFLYLETVGEHFIRVDEIRGGKSIPLVQLHTRPQVTEYANAHSLEVHETHFNEGELRKVAGKKSLAAEALPFPYCRLSIEFLNELEAKLCGTEVGLLTLDSERGSMTLLLQFVRGQRVRVGVLKEASATVADDYFGTSVTRLYHSVMDPVVIPLSS